MIINIKIKVQEAEGTTTQEVEHGLRKFIEGKLKQWTIENFNKGINAEIEVTNDKLVEQSKPI